MRARNVVGAVMGVREDLLPADFTAGKALAARISDRHFASCPDGHAITRALLDIMSCLVPGTLVDRVPAEFVRHLVGDRIADMLAVPASSGHTGVIAVSRLLGRVGDRSLAFQSVARVLGRALVQGLLFTHRGGKRLPFAVPTVLRQARDVHL